MIASPNSYFDRVLSHSQSLKTQDLYEVGQPELLALFSIEEFPPLCKFLILPEAKVLATQT